MPARNTCTRHVDGVTYLPATELAKMMRVDRGTVHNWVDSGAVRALPKLRGIAYASVADALLLRLETPEQTRARGVLRSSAEHLALVRAWSERERDTTGSEATRSGEEWEATEEARLVEMFEAGAPIEEIAVRLGRTYGAVSSHLSYLRDEVGTRKPRVQPVGVAWMEPLARMLTPEESDALTEALSRKPAA